MLTPLTLAAISVLRQISYKEEFDFQEVERGGVSPVKVLNLLESAKLIRHKPGCAESNTPKAYGLLRPFHEITLFDVMMAVDEHLDCSQPNSKVAYAYYQRSAQKLGIINQLTRNLLSEILLTDL